MPSVHLRGHLNKFSPPNGWELDLFRQMCQYDTHIQAFSITNRFHCLVLCLLQELFDNVYNVFGAPRSVLREG